MTGSKEMFHDIRQAENETQRESIKVDSSKASHETGLSLDLQDWKGLNKASIKEKVDAVVTTIQEGWVDPVEALIFAKKGVELFGSLEKNVRELAEAKGVGKAGIEQFNVKVSEAMTGVKYDYEKCNDTEWEIISGKLEAFKAALKVREKFLQGITKDLEIVDTETGETNTIHPPIKSGKLGLKCEVQ